MSDTRGRNPASLANLEPAFEHGNVASRRHGGYSPTFLREEAKPVVEELFEIAPWLRAPEFLPAVANYAEMLMQAAVLTRMAADITAERGAIKVPSRTWEQITAARNAAHRMATDFGITPQGRARLAATATAADLGQASLADLAAKGAEINRLRDAEIVPIDDEGEEDEA